MLTWAERAACVARFTGFGWIGWALPISGVILKPGAVYGDRKLGTTLLPLGLIFRPHEVSCADGCATCPRWHADGWPSCMHAPQLVMTLPPVRGLARAVPLLDALLTPSVRCESRPPSCPVLKYRECSASLAESPGLSVLSRDYCVCMGGRAGGANKYAAVIAAWTPWRRLRSPAPPTRPS